MWTHATGVEPEFNPGSSCSVDMPLYTQWLSYVYQKHLVHVGYWEINKLSNVYLECIQNTLVNVLISPRAGQLDSYLYRAGYVQKPVRLFIEC